MGGRSDIRFAPARTVARVLLGSMLMFAGTSHLTFAREPFQAQVPPWFPVDPDRVVLASGVVEIALGATVALAPERQRRLIGECGRSLLRRGLPRQHRPVPTAPRSVRPRHRPQTCRPAARATPADGVGRVVHPHR